MHLALLQFATVNVQLPSTSQIKNPDMLSSAAQPFYITDNTALSGLYTDA